VLDAGTTERSIGQGYDDGLAELAVRYGVEGDD